MLSREMTEALGPRIKVMQIIVGALIMGALVALVMMMIVKEMPKFNNELGFLTIFGIGFALISFLVSYCLKFILGKQMVRVRE